MPTDEEFKELQDKCEWTWTTINGVNGYKIVMPNNESIFLPAAGYMRAQNNNSISTSGFYWSNTLNTDCSSVAKCLNFSSKGIFDHEAIRYDGQTIRPVYDDNL